MQTIAKTQVLALLLGAASASTLTALGLLNGPSDVAKVPTGQKLTTKNSGTACNSNADCKAAGEKCGAFQRTGVTTENFCVASDYCNSVGKLNSVEFALICWETPTTGTATAPAAVDPKKLVAAYEDFITESTVNWTSIANLWVSPKFRFQDGWWEENSSGKFVETDKKEDTRCFVNRQCTTTANQCCMSWPDANNTRCKDKALEGKEQTVGFTKFTPTCKVDAKPTPGGTTVKPENAKQDLAAGALAAAKENLGKFYDNILKDKKTAEGYDKMDATAKAKFDSEQAATKAKREALWTELKKEAKADQTSCGDDCKAIFEADLLKWGKAVYETCKADAKSIECREAEKIKKAEEKARAAGTKNYYLMTPTEREAFTTARKADVAKEKSSLAAAWLKNNRPASGKDGAVCLQNKCSDKQCCGTSKPAAADVPKGATTLAKVCVTSTDKKTGSWTNDFKWKYTHTCDVAKNLIATGAAFATAAYALM